MCALLSLRSLRPTVLEVGRTLFPVFVCHF
jgi:hypothetical protein